MLTASIILVLIGGIWFVARLWTVRKHNRILYTMYDYRREITSLMRSDRMSTSIDRNDYRKLRRTLDNTNLVIEDFEKNEPAFFDFIQYIQQSGKQAFRADVRQQRLSLAQNEEVKHHQKNLQRLLSWSVYYRTPMLFRNKPLLTFFLNLFGCNRQKMATQKESYSEWMGRHVSQPLTKDFSAEL